VAPWLVVLLDAAGGWVVTLLPPVAG
jgi:hypothetical protein